MRSLAALAFVVVLMPGCVREQKPWSPISKVDDTGGQGDAVDSAAADIEPEVMCKTACEGRECGPDGCGGSCGECAGANTECPESGQCACQYLEDCGGACCDDGQVCDEDSCCSPSCQGKGCGGDGCGGWCGICDVESGQYCNKNDWTCSCPEDAQMCPPDGLESICCLVDSERCVGIECCPWQANCVGKTKGESDGCGGACGNCNLNGKCEPQLGEECHNCPEDCQDCCGNDVCEWEFGESFEDCPQDCEPGCICGDDVCNGGTACGETSETCCADCNACGNGLCECGESFKTCPFDCCGTCPDNKCANYLMDGVYYCTEDVTNCAEDCAAEACGNGECAKGQNPYNCPQDCGLVDQCGNNLCEFAETAASCPLDCGGQDWDCGDCLCQYSFEDFLSCPGDCGVCGDGYCSDCPGLAETPELCPEDCGA